jgi:hypothetical protein
MSDILSQSIVGVSGDGQEVTPLRLCALQKNNDMTYKWM